MIQSLKHILHLGRSPKDTSLRLHRLDSGIMQHLLGGCSAVLHEQTIEASVISLSHGRVHADVCRDAGDDQILDA